jgi:hypothetical protein
VSDSHITDEGITLCAFILAVALVFCVFMHQCQVEQNRKLQREIWQAEQKAGTS